MSATITGKMFLAVLLPCDGIEHGLFQLVERLMIPPVLELVLLNVALTLEMPRGQRDLDFDPGNAVGYSFINATIQRYICDLKYKMLVIKLNMT